jgi:hypothetical protein
MLSSIVFLLILFTTASSQQTGVSLRVDDLGTGAKESLIRPAQLFQESIREFFEGNNTRLGIENDIGSIIYNLTDNPQAGLSSLRINGKTIYDQQPYFVVNTNTGVKWTNQGQGKIFEKNMTSSGYYRDFYFRPFRFAGYDNAIGEFQYHIFPNKFHEETRISTPDISQITDVWVEYPIDFSSYQLYEGTGLTPVTKTEISTGALLVKRPNGSLFGFVFPQSSRNSKVQLEISGNTIKVKHHANMNVTELSSRPGSSQRKTVVTWGRRLLMAESYDLERDRILNEARLELNPLGTNAFSIQRIGNDGNRYSSWVDPVVYDELTGVYTFTTEGIPWGDAVKPGGWPNKYPGAQITINNPTENRLIHMRHYTTTPNTAALLQDGNGFVLPINLGVTRSLGGVTEDWTGAFANESPFVTEVELDGFGRSEFPVQLFSGQSISFRPLQVVHKWGGFQVPATGSVMSAHPLFTSNVGVWCSVDLQPWKAMTGDFRGFSSEPMQWAWGIQQPEYIEQFGGGFHYYFADIGDRVKEFQDSRSVVPSLSHFKMEADYKVDGGKFDLTTSFSAVPDTDENRILSDVEVIVNQDITLAPGERIKLIHFMSDHIFMYNAFFSSNAQGQLNPQYIAVPKDLHTPSSHIQTVILEGQFPAMALADKRFAFDPENANPTHESFAKMQANVYVQVFSKELQLQGQDGSGFPIALKVSKVKPAGGFYDGSGQYIDHYNYVNYDVVLEKEGLSLKAGDRLKFSFMVMSYGGKILNNEVTSAQNTLNNYKMPEVISVSGSTANVQTDYPWVPVVKSTDGSTANFEIQGGEGVMTFSVEGLHSWKPIRLYKWNGSTQQEVSYSVNGHDGYRSYIDPDGLIGISIPVEMTNGSLSKFQVIQDNAGVTPPISSSSSNNSSSSINTSSSSQADPGNFWDFEGSQQGWTLTQGLINNFHSSLLRLTVTQADPQMHSPSNLKLYAGDYPFLQFGMRNRSNDTLAEFFWTRNTGPAFNANKWKVFNIIPNDNAQRTYVVDLNNHATYIDTITQLRFDPLQNSLDGTVNLDFIKFSAAYPIANQPHSVPGIIQAEDFNQGGQGNGYNDISTANQGGAYRPDEGVDIQSISGGGHALGWVQSGEWLDYLIRADSDFSGDILIRAASVHQGDSIQLLLNGRALGEAIVFNAGQGLEDYQDFSTTATMPAGLHVLRIQIIKAAGGLNLDYVEFKHIEAPVGQIQTQMKIDNIHSRHPQRSYDLKGRVINGDTKGLWFDSHKKLRINL